MQNPELWARMEKAAFPAEIRQRIDEDLMYGWRRRPASSAIEEYKRFLYLRVVRGQKSAAPWPVDGVWRRHMSSPEAYTAFCIEYLGQVPVYKPVLGMMRERIDGYSAMLAAYAEEFGEPAPSHFWPAVPPRRGLSFWLAAIALMSVGLTLVILGNALVWPGFAVIGAGFWMALSALPADPMSQSGGQGAGGGFAGVTGGGGDCG